MLLLQLAEPALNESCHVVSVPQKIGRKNSVKFPENRKHRRHLLLLVPDRDHSICRAIRINSCRQAIRRVLLRRPRHTGRHAILKPQVDAREHRRTGRIVADRSDIVRLEGLAHPGELLRDADDGERRAANVSECRVVGERGPAGGG